MTAPPSPVSSPTAPGVFEVRPRPHAEPNRSERGLGVEPSWLEAEGRRLGFARLGCVPAHGLEATLPAFQRWLAAGYHGAMQYLERPRLTPAQLLPGAKTVVVGVMSYGAANVGQAAAVAAYARGEDYHVALKRQLRALAQSCADHTRHSFRARVCVDTAPVLERAWATRAGLAFVGKSTLAITPGVGTATVLGELLLDIELPLSETRTAAEGCGRCQRCLDACPTQAFTSAYSLDARRCISYLTIESRASIPLELRPLMGQHLFGCDVCQSVCPYNWSTKLPPSAADLTPRGGLPSALELLNITTGDYKRLVKGTALSRASRPQLQRNAAVALGNAGDPRAVPSLAAALEHNPNTLVRAHVAWALGQIGGASAVDALLAAQRREAMDVEVQEEISKALVAARRSR